MTIDEKIELCIKIAKAEGWERKVQQHRLNDDPKIFWVRPEDGYPVLESKLVEHFFASAEIVRMLKKLAEWGVVHLLKIDTGEEWVCGISIVSTSPRALHRHNFKADTPERAINEAYLAMLLEKAK